MRFLNLSLGLISLWFARGRSATPPVSWTPFVYTSAAGDTVAADSARVVVPENRAHPTGKTIQLAVVRIRSTAANPGAPIVYLAGGPGGSGISGGRGELFPTVLALRGISDVILFDQRGTGQTLPSMVTRRTLGGALDKSSWSPEAKEALLANARAALDEVRARGNDPTAYNTNENADDVEDLRAALGAPKLIVWGHSYGSHLGLTYIRRHGASVERAILGGINGPDHRRRFPSDGDVLLRRIDSLTKATPSLNAVMPDFLGMTRRVLDRLARTPAVVTVDSQTVLVSREDVQTVIALQSGEQAFVRRLPLMIGQLDAGEYAAMARLVRDGVKNRPLGTVMTYMTDLASGVSPARARRIRAEIPTALLGDAINYPFDDPDFQAVWSAPDLGAAFRAPVRSSVPALFISGTVDGRTSLADAEEVRRGFPNNAHVVVRGASHNIYATTPQLLDAIVRFARGERVRDLTVNATNLEFRGPDEPALSAELRRVLAAGGGAAVATRLREAAAPGSGHHVTSGFVSELVSTLARTDRAAADTVVRTGLALFPNGSSLLTRLAELRAAGGDKAGAAASYRAALQADPFNQAAAVQLKRN